MLSRAGIASFAAYVLLLVLRWAAAPLRAHHRRTPVTALGDHGVGQQRQRATDEDQPVSALAMASANRPVVGRPLQLVKRLAAAEPLVHAAPKRRLGRIVAVIDTHAQLAKLVKRAEEPRASSLERQRRAAQ